MCVDCQSQHKVRVTMNTNDPSCTEVVDVHFDSVAAAYTLHTVIGNVLLNEQVMFYLVTRLRYVF